MRGGAVKMAGGCRSDAVAARGLGAFSALARAKAAHPANRSHRLPGLDWGGVATLLAVVVAVAVAAQAGWSGVGFSAAAMRVGVSLVLGAAMLVPAAAVLRRVAS